ncbi:methanethiol S-methyltransferase [Altererythrobacter sp. GH1-8]|uniref:methanethiol S-methyltransferase n=1 Tax=Altererythrobacter sp. GH1-8 TaxID=3349333 RepID=UPI00374D9B04
MGRLFLMLVSVAFYSAAVAALVFLIGWVGAFDFMPLTVDKGREAPLTTALAVNIALLALFGLQHSVMARPGFKAGWTKIIPEPIERSFYLLATVLVLGALFHFWHPIEGVLWSVQNEAARVAIWTVFWAGWAILLLSTFLLNHFELFGLQQAWQNLSGKQAAPPMMRTPLFYKLVRHPLYTGFFLGLWATPDMTYSHALMAAGFTVYIVIGISYEERDLLGVFGEQYAEYRKRVGAFLPGIGKQT